MDWAISLLKLLREPVCSLSRIGMVVFHFPFVLLISPPTSNSNNWLSEQSQKPNEKLLKKRMQNLFQTVNQIESGKRAKTFVIGSESLDGE